MTDKTNSSQEQYDRYLRENADIVRDWPDWMKEGARSVSQPVDRAVLSLKATDDRRSKDCGDE